MLRVGSQVTEKGFGQMIHSRCWGGFLVGRSAGGHVLKYCHKAKENREQNCCRNVITKFSNPAAENTAAFDSRVLLRAIICDLT